jgi:hypothetical protein
VGRAGRRADAIRVVEHASGDETAPDLGQAKRAIALHELQQQPRHRGGLGGEAQTSRRLEYGDTT